MTVVVKRNTKTIINIDNKRTPDIPPPPLAEALHPVSLPITFFNTYYPITQRDGLEEPLRNPFHEILPPSPTRVHKKNLRL